MREDVEIFDTKEALSQAAVEYWISLCQEAIASHDGFYVALAGGSTPKRLYELLAETQNSHRIDWSKVHIFFGDERMVPPDHPDSNFLMARNALLDIVPIPENQVHPMDTSVEDAWAGAKKYADEIERIIPQSYDNFPRIDLVLLGMGGDGHTASLFPDTDILKNDSDCVGAVFVKKLDSWRISLTFPVINHAANILVLVAGDDKAPVLAKVLTGELCEPPYPIQMLRPKGQIRWLLDSAAAAQWREQEK